MSISTFEQNIYNKFLAVSRSSLNKPFKLRKDFTDFEDNENYFYVRKLGLFFKKFDKIEIDEFFKAPYMVYNKDQMYDIKFYTTQKALKIYTLYQTKKMDELPDSLNQLYFIKNSLNFILKFCKRENIQPRDYIDHKTNDMYSFILHLKEHKISIYVLFGFERGESSLKSLGPDLLEFMFGNLKNKLDIFRTRYYTSTKAKVLVKEGIKKIT